MNSPTLSRGTNSNSTTTYTNLLIYGIASVVFISYIYSGMFWTIIYKEMLIDQKNVYFSLSALAIITILWLMSLSLRFRNGFFSEMLLLVLLIAYLLICALYSPSIVSRNSEINFVLLNIPACFIIGYIIYFQGFVLEFATCLIAMALYGLLTINIELTYEAKMEDININYQTINALFSGAAIMSFAIILDSRKHRAVRAVLACGLIIFSFAILYTGGRGGLLFVLAGTLAMLIGVLKRYIVRLFLLSGVMIVTIGLNYDSIIDAIIVFANEHNLATVQRIVYYVSTGNNINTVENRETLAELAWSVWNSNILFGVGLGGFPVAAGYGDANGLYPHNIALNILADLGLAGAVILCAYFGRYYIVAYKSIVYTNKLEKLILVGLAAGDIAALTVFGAFSSDRVLWVTLGACSAIYVKYKRNCPGSLGRADLAR